MVIINWLALFETLDSFYNNKTDETSPPKLPNKTLPHRSAGKLETKQERPVMCSFSGSDIGWESEPYA